MNRIYIILRKILILVTVVVAGICIISALAVMQLDNTLFSREFHHKLLIKYDIYSQTKNVIDTYLNEYLDNLKAVSPESLEQQKQLFSVVDKAIAPEMIKLNINMFTDGLFKYFNGDTRFLPDIYLNPIPDKPITDKPITDNQIPNVSNSPVNENSLSQIDRINFSVILTYLNRDDITEKLSVIRLLKFITANLPVFLSLLSIFSLLGGILLIKSKSELMHWLYSAFLLSGLTALTTGALILAGLYFILPHNITFPAISIPLPDELIAGYIHSCIFPISVYLLITGFILTSAGFIIKLLPKKTLIPRTNEKSSSFMAKNSKTIVCVLLMLITFTVTIVQAESLKDEFHSRDLSVVLDRIKGISSFTKVISASNDNVYALEIRVEEKKTNSPVEGVFININGKSSTTHGSFSQSMISDALGVIKYPVDKGTYRLSFNPDDFPDNYMMPSPFFFDIKSAGTTIITVSLINTEVDKLGMVELEILDKNNLPVRGIELVLEKQQALEFNTGRILSFTNSEGSAVFRVPAGEYKVLFSDSGFPDEYIIPDPYNIDVFSDFTVKCSTKLALKPIPKSKVKK